MRVRSILAIAMDAMISDMASGQGALRSNDAGLHIQLQMLGGKHGKQPTGEIGRRYRSAYGNFEGKERGVVSLGQALRSNRGEIDVDRK